MVRFPWQACWLSRACHEVAGQERLMSGKTNRLLSPLERRLARMHVVLEVGKALPGRLDRVAGRAAARTARARPAAAWGCSAGSWGRWRRAFTRTISCAPTVSASSGSSRETRGLAVDAQPARLLVHVDEQQADVGIDQQVAQALEHAVAVVVGEGQLVRRRHAHEAGRAALEGAVRAPIGVGCGEEEIDCALDEGLVVGGEGRARRASAPAGRRCAGCRTGPAAGGCPRGT